MKYDKHLMLSDAKFSFPWHFPSIYLSASRGHHCEIRHHVAMAEEGAEGLHGVGDAAAALDDFLIGGFGVHVPLPGVFERP